MYQVLVWGGRELLATIDKSLSTISDATLLQWKNKYRYLLITMEYPYSTSYMYYLSFLTPSEEFYNFFAGTNVGTRIFGERNLEIIKKSGTTATTPNQWYTPGGTVKIYGFTF